MARSPMLRRGIRRPAAVAAFAAAAATASLALFSSRGSREAFVSAAPKPPADGRRAALGQTIFGAGAVAGLWVPGEAAHASGGSTAGKYSTIPSAKRRFYGRVRQGIYEFLQLEAPLKQGELQAPAVQSFFAKSIIKQAGGEKIPGCALVDCVTKEKRTSRWNDLKAATDLLASAFRYSSEDVNDYLPQVRLIRSCAKKVEKMQKAIDAGDAQQARTLYANAKRELNQYTKMVELSPLDSEDYTHSWDTRPIVICNGNFCN